MDRLRQLLWGIAATMGVVVGLRWIWGPFTLVGVPVNIPLNPEGIFGLLVTLQLGFMVSDTIFQRAEGGRWVAGVVAGLAVAALYPALLVGFLSDDFILVRQTLGPVFTTGGGDGFFRPLGYVSFALNAGLGNDPLWWHLVSLGLHTVNALLVALLAKRLGASAWIAFVAGGLFALHGTHLEAAVWIAGRFDLLAALFTLAALLSFGRSTLAALAFTLAALWSKEAAFVLPALITLLAWHEKRALRDTIGFWALAGVAFLYRWVLLGGIGGYREQSGESAFYSLKFPTTAKAVFVRVWTSLYFPLNWSLEPGTITALFACAYIGALLWLAWKARPVPRIVLAALLISILPPLHLLGGATDLSGGRLLYLPSIWFCLMLAFATSSLGRRHTIVVTAILLGFHFAAVRHDLSFWQRASNQVQTLCSDPSTTNPPRSIDGVPALANGHSECSGR